MKELDDYFEHARAEMFPKMKESAISLVIAGEPDPKLCMEIGAAIMFDKPILAIVRRGQDIPLSLRTIAHKVVEVTEPMDEASKNRLQSAINQMIEASQFRGKRGES